MLDKNKNKLPFMKNTKTALFSSLLAGSVMLTACGGGGGSGGGGKDLGGPVEDRVTLVTEFPEIITRDDNFSVEASFVEIVRGDFKAMMNGTDVTHLFGIGATSATASLASLFSYIDDGNNTFKVSAGGDTESDTFVADIVSGRIIVTSASAQDDKKIAQAGENVFLDGFTRKSKLESILLNGAEVKSFTFNESTKSFEFKDVPAAFDNNEKSDTQADYTFIAQYEGGAETKTHYAANGRHLETLGGIQINDSVFDELKPIIADLLGAWLDENMDDITIAPDSNALAQYCALMPSNLLGGKDDAACRISITDLGVTEDPNVIDLDGNDLNVKIDKDRFNITIPSQPKYLDAGDGFEILVYIPLGDFNVDLDVMAYLPPIQGDNSNVYGGVQSRLTLDSGTFMTMRLMAYKEDSDDGAIGIRFPEKSEDGDFAKAFAFSGSFLADYKGSQCKIGTLDSDFCKTNPTESALTSALRIGFNSVDLSATLDQQFDGVLNTVVTNGEGTQKSLRDFVKDNVRFKNLTATSSTPKEAPTLISTQTILAGLIKTSVYESSNGGLITLGGGTEVSATDTAKLDDIKPYIGSAMNVETLSMIDDGGIESDKHLGIALSENLLNQLLMPTYQSGGLLNKDVITIPANQLVSAITAGNINITVDANTQPRLRLQKDGSVKLFADDITVDVSIVGGVTSVLGIPVNINNGDVMNAVVDVEARMTVKVENNQPVFDVKESDIIVSVPFIRVVHPQAKDFLTADDAKEALIKALPQEIATLVSDLNDKLIPAAKPIPVDVEKILTADESTEQNASYGLVREQLPQTFVLKLSSDGISVDNNATALIFKGNLEEKIDNTQGGLLELKFCSSSTYEIEAERCPVSN